MKNGEQNVKFKESKATGYICAVLAEVIFGFAYIFTKDVTETVTPYTLLCWRFVIAYIVFQLLRMAGVIKINFTGKNFKKLFLICLLSPVIYFLGENIGINLTTASESSIVIAIVPVTTIIASVIMLKKKVIKLEIFGIIVTFVGVILCAACKGLEMSFDIVGYLMLVMAIIAFSIYSVIVEKGIEFTTAELTYAMALVGAVIFTIIAVITHAGDGIVENLILVPFRNSEFLAAILYEGIGCSVIAFFLMNFSISKIGASTNAVFAGVSTFVSIVASVLILKEDFRLMQIIGTVLLLAGVYIATALPLWLESRKNKLKKT